MPKPTRRFLVRYRLATISSADRPAPLRFTMIPITT
jgi:hypothetical protein